MWLPSPFAALRATEAPREPGQVAGCFTLDPNPIRIILVVLEANQTQQGFLPETVFVWKD